MKSYEVNFDGLVGPTHNYAGLAFGNQASAQHGHQLSSPKAAALQGLKKMKYLSELGLKQGVLPPHERPHLPTLRRLGFTGSDVEVLAQAAKQAPYLLSGVSSASSMWVANAATVTPFADSQDGKTHFTPANLSSMFHRSIEPEITGRMLQRIFAGSDYCHHAPLSGARHLSDEGAANHNRLCASYGEPGLELFVYGQQAFNREGLKPQQFPARQTLEASQTIARLHRLAPQTQLFAQQLPEAIDAGVFHNDVIAVANRNLLFYHQQAFVNSTQVKAQLSQAWQQLYQGRNQMPELHFIEVPGAEVSLDQAVTSYLFNSQLVYPEQATGAHIIVPTNCAEDAAVKAYLDKLPAQHPVVEKVHYLDVKQSMNNGGGPACLRLRVVMSQAQIEGLQSRVLLTPELYQELVAWVERHYRDQLSPEDLADPSLLAESRAALDELTQLLNLGALYEFQQD